MFFSAILFLQQKLTELRNWSEKVRNFDRNFISENGMFFVDCSAIHEGLLPRLNDIYQELITFVADEAKSLAANFMDEMRLITKVSHLWLIGLTGVQITTRQLAKCQWNWNW
jgi:hypothetical protein